MTAALRFKSLLLPACMLAMCVCGQSAIAADDINQHTDELRTALLGVKGVGPETADDILLYAFNRPVFVIDAYTRRLFGRLGRFNGNEGYDEMRQAFERVLGPDVLLFNEYHALIVRHAKEVCRVRPACGQCLLARDCPAAGRLG